MQEKMYKKSNMLYICLFFSGLAGYFTWLQRFYLTIIEL